MQGQCINWWFNQKANFFVPGTWKTETVDKWLIVLHHTDRKIDASRWFLHAVHVSESVVNNYYFLFSDQKADTILKIDSHDIIVPQGKPKKIPEYSGSSFYQSEYLVYREDQVRMRYLLLFDM